MPDLGLGNHAWSGPEMRPRRRRLACNRERSAVGTWKAHDGLDPRPRIARLDTAGAQFVLDDVDARAHNVRRDGTPHDEKSVDAEIVNRCRHLAPSSLFLHRMLVPEANQVS